MSTPTRCPEQLPGAVLRMGACRPGGCAGLCTADGLARAYRAYRAPLLARARRILGDSGLAEEVVQETFLRAWRACASFDPDGPPMLAWLGVVLRNLAVDRIKARSRRPALAFSVPREDSVASTRPDEVEVLLLRVGITAALAGLRADQRTAVLETVVRDRPHGEVAAELGIPVGTLRSRAHYALRRMRRVLEAGDEAGPPRPAAPTENSARLMEER